MAIKLSNFQCRKQKKCRLPANGAIGGGPLPRLTFDAISLHSHFCISIQIYTYKWPETLLKQVVGTLQVPKHKGAKEARFYFVVGIFDTIVIEQLLPLLLLERVITTLDRYLYNVQS